MKKSQKILIGIAIVVGLLLIVPFLIPMQTYLQQAEKIASEKLGQPVSINSARLVFLPSPRVAVNGIVVGKHAELKLEQLVVIPTIATLFSDVKTLDLQIIKPIVKQAGLDFISALLAEKSADSAPATMHIRHIKIDELHLGSCPVMNAKATLMGESKLESALVKTLDGKLDATITPDGDTQLIIVNAKKLTLPVGLPLLIDNAKLEMHLKDSKLSISNMDIALYGGKLTGNAELNWQKNWRLQGKLKVDNLAVKQPSRLVSKAVYLSGNLFGNGSFSAKAKDAEHLAENLRADFKFKVNNGVLHGLDLVRVASLLLKQNQSGGETQFDAFSGVLNVSGKQYHLRNLNISSGLLAATGQVKVKPNKTLDGDVVVDVKAGMGLAGIPLEVSGTVNNPVVLPNKAAVAGAIAGTAVLPGVGTSIGAKVGAKTGETLDKLKNLFGN